MRQQASTTTKTARTIRLDPKPINDEPFGIEEPPSSYMTPLSVAEKTSRSYVGSYRDALTSGVFVNTKCHRVGEVDLEWNAIYAARQWPHIEIFRSRTPGPCSVVIDFSTSRLPLLPADFKLLEERVASLPKYDSESGQRIGQLLGGEEYGNRLIIHRVPARHLDVLYAFGLRLIVRPYLLPPFTPPTAKPIALREGA